MHKLFLAKLTTGEEYTGNQQFAGLGGYGAGITKWCSLCGVHKIQLGGTIQHVMGGRHWVCAKHKKPAVSK